MSEEISHQDQFEYNNNNHNNNSNSNNSQNQQVQQQPSSILLTSSNNSSNSNQQHPPVLLASTSLSISSSEIPFVIANHLSTLTPTNVNEPPSLFLANNNISNSNGNNNKQKWFVQSGEHINGRTCLGLSNKMDGKFHQLEPDTQKVKIQSHIQIRFL